MQFESRSNYQFVNSPIRKWSSPSHVYPHRVSVLVHVQGGVPAGVLGMNFKTPFFDTGDTGFWTAIGVMLGFAVFATAFARWRRWF